MRSFLNQALQVSKDIIVIHTAWHSLINQALQISKDNNVIHHMA